MREAVAIVGEEYGERSLKRADALGRLASMLCDVPGRRDEALAVANTARKIYDNSGQPTTAGSEHREILLAILARVHRERHELPQAEKYGQQALNWCELNLEAADNRSLAARVALAEILADRERLPEARGLLKQAHDFATATPLLVPILNLEALSATSAGDFPQAVALYRQAVQILERPLISKPEQLADVRTGFADALTRSGQPEEAARQAQMAYDWRRATLGPDQWRTMSSLSVLGGALAAGSNPAGAGTMLTEAARKLVDNPAAPTRIKKLAVERLLRYLKSHGEASDVEPWQKQLDRLSSLPE